MNEIHESRKFYNWLQNIINERYSHQQCNIYECSGGGETTEYINKADELINMILNMTVPEIDMDQYHMSLNISAEDYANKNALKFKFTTPNLSAANSSS